MLSDKQYVLIGMVGLGTLLVSLILYLIKKDNNGIVQ